ncbi:ribonuclease D [Raineyella antarctica]|uniref:Ribonuclease D n=2 Tax=Raineyella antarctica TaxID=1577474 RepID=A0A1G6GPK2_9ACTN|nr:HRDC domain-containing protein [Raineyella antarctica]SDB83952.1 ribonuclease D [Raineyella antarctica]
MSPTDGDPALPHPTDADPPSSVEHPTLDTATLPEEELPVLRAPKDGVPVVSDTQAAYEELVAALAAGEGPVGIDTERAHGFRYSPKAWLIQLRRRGSGTFLLDPDALAPADELADLSALREAIGDAEWIIHAASQDLPCLVEVGLRPSTIFDTELAGRLLGYPRVSLGAMAERFCGVHLLKEHSAADWSTRPLPEDWLVYAALDVELLRDLRDAIAEELRIAGKDEWARQEFAYLVQEAGTPKTPREEPWRRVSGIHDIRSRRELALVRELWQTREAIAARRDKAPGRLLNDRVIIAAATRKGLTAGTVGEMSGFHKGVAKRYLNDWSDAVRRVEAMDPTDYPALRPPRRGNGAPRTWQGHHPEAYARFMAAREAMNKLAEEHQLPPENLLTPDTWHRLCWEPPTPLSPATVEEHLAAAGARPWQRDLVRDALAQALATTA